MRIQAKGPAGMGQHNRPNRTDQFWRWKMFHYDTDTPAPTEKAAESCCLCYSEWPGVSAQHILKKITVKPPAFYVCLAYTTVQIFLHLNNSAIFQNSEQGRLIIFDLTPSLGQR